MRKLWILVALNLMGCGPSWDGRYTGTLTQTGSCSDGSGVPPSTIDADWTLTEKSTGLEVQTDGNCGTQFADVDGTTATFRPKSCPPYSNQGYNYQPSTSGGSLALNDDKLTATIKSLV